MPRLPSVSRSASSIAPASAAPARWRRPVKRTRTPRSCSPGASALILRASIASSARTSPCGRAQFSVENAYSVSCATPSSIASAIRSTTVVAAASWPSPMDRPCAWAQRALPSLTIATCRARSGACASTAWFSSIGAARACRYILCDGKRAWGHAAGRTFYPLTVGQHAATRSSSLPGEAVVRDAMTIDKSGEDIDAQRLLAVFDEASAQVCAAMTGAYRAADCWVDAIRSALAELLAFLDHRPGLARLLIVDALVGDSAI